MGDGSKRKYWLIRGEFGTAFARDVDERLSSVAGPFWSYDEARAAWRRRAAEANDNPNVRFTIAQEA